MNKILIKTEHELELIIVKHLQAIFLTLLMLNIFMYYTPPQFLSSYPAAFQL